MPCLTGHQERRKQLLKNVEKGRKVKLMIEGDGMTQDDFLIHSFLVFVDDKDGSFFLSSEKVWMMCCIDQQT
jgi:hypothetical protein